MLKQLRTLSRCLCPRPGREGIKVKAEGSFKFNLKNLKNKKIKINGYYPGDRSVLFKVKIKIFSLKDLTEGVIPYATQG
jgi:hypothetical protein